MIYLRVHFLFNSAKRKFNWNDIPNPLLGLAGLFRRDLYEDAYAMNQREENEEGG